MARVMPGLRTPEPDDSLWKGGTVGRGPQNPGPLLPAWGVVSSPRVSRLRGSGPRARPPAEQAHGTARHRLLCHTALQAAASPPPEAHSWEVS